MYRARDERLDRIVAINRHQYSPSADGQRFLVATVSEAPIEPIKVILNWPPRP